MQESPGSNGNAGSRPGSIARTQYHYMYGSVESSSSTTLNANTGESNEHDSLIGDSFVITDNEEEHGHQEGTNSKNGGVQKAGSSSQLGSKTGYSHILLRTLATILLFGSAGLLLIISSPKTKQPIPGAQRVVVPFVEIDRADYGDPVEEFVEMNLFHPTLIRDNGRRTFRFPFPTGAFWTNLVVPSPDPKYSYPIVVYPYAYKWSESSLQMSYPSQNRIEDKNHHWIIDTFVPELTICTAETASQRFVSSFDPLSVTLEYTVSSESSWETTLVMGSPYATIKYKNSTPQFGALSTFKAVLCPGNEAEDFHDIVGSDNDQNAQRRKLFGVCSMDESDGRQTVRGVQFMLLTSEGHYWIIFASEPITLSLNTDRRTTLLASAPFSGIIRVARIPQSEVSGSSTGLRRLIYHAGIYPTGTRISWDFHTAESSSPVGRQSTSNHTDDERYAIVKFDFETESMTDTSLRPTGPSSLLMLALPHHARLLSRDVQLSQTKFDLTYSCIKGPMSPVIGSRWQYKEPLISFEFDEKVPILNSDISDAILQQVEADMDRVLPTRDENVYGFGKQVARLAQVVHIASRLEENTSSNSTLTNKGKEILLSFLQDFLTSRTDDSLVFDGNLGGLVSVHGLSDPTADFGNGRYNDHHFHYGYILYACAIMGRLDPNFSSEYGDFVDAIFHDVVYFKNYDSAEVQKSHLFFPFTRHKSWFDGHSFATGMFPFGDGKSQESSSEAVNCYYGAYLWSLTRQPSVIDSVDLKDFTNLLLAMEVRSTKAYWHMQPSLSDGLEEDSHVQIYSDDFARNVMVGNVGMLDVAVNTWFGNDPLYVDMINAMPITAITSFLFDSKFTKILYDSLLARGKEVEMAWRGYVVAVHAIIDANSAWLEAGELVSYELDAAISKSQVMYWICQREEFNVSTSSVNAKNETHVDSSCSSFTLCSQQGLVGSCCPAANGAFLGCCEATNETSRADSQCSENPRCLALGLEGSCCPTAEGTVLGCCNGM